MIDAKIKKKRKVKYSIKFFINHKNIKTDCLQLRIFRFITENKTMKIEIS